MSHVTSLVIILNTLERIQVSLQADCLKLCKLLQAHTGMSLSQLGNAALRMYLINTIENDRAFRDLAFAMKTTPGSLADTKLKEMRKLDEKSPERG